jgi:LysM repeat protein
MTAITFSAPPSLRHRAAAARAAQAGSKWATKSQAARLPHASQLPTSSLRLTRRGRLVITGVLASVAIAASLFVGGVGTAGTDATPVPTRYITVAPGETLWAIAGEVAPSADRRDTVQRILELNSLRSANVQAGQQLAVPAS